MKSRSSRPQPTDEEWLRHKPAIRRLYLVDELPLKKLVVDLEQLGLSVTTSQLEYKLKQWGFRKNIDKATWVIIDHKIAKRKREGKDSQVIHCGKRLKPTTVEKETNRHRDMSIFSQLHPPSSPPASPNNVQIAVCTPPSLSMEFIWPSTLPWLRFQARFSNLLSNGLQKSNSEAICVMHPPAKLSNHLLPIFSQSSGLQSTEAQSQVSKLAANIGKFMPESYPEENLQRAQTFLHGSNDDIIRENLASVIFSISNNLSNLMKFNTWSKTWTILQAWGILKIETNVWKLQDPIIRGFAEKLFRAAAYWTIMHFKDDGPYRSHTFALFKRLASSGLSPDLGILTPYFGYKIATPLQLAARKGDLEMAHYLLDIGADVNLSLPNGESDSPLELGLQNYEAIDGIRMTELLLKYGASTNLERALHLATLGGYRTLLKGIIKQGANIRSVWKSECTFIYEHSALAIAASRGGFETQLFLGLLAAQDPTKPKDTFITADVFVAAAAEGMNDSIRLLHRICPDVTSANFYGITPLHAAVCRGHLDTCQLILQLHGSYPSPISFISPLHLTLHDERADIAHFLINSGADVNIISRVPRPFDKRNLLYYMTHFESDSYPVATPLEMLLSPSDRGYRGWDSHCPKSLDRAVALVQAGSRLTGGEVSLAVTNLHLGLLSATLAAGGDPNENLDGTSALQRALRVRDRTKRADAASAAKLLLEWGATPVGGEVVSAIFLGDEELANCLIRRCDHHYTETDRDGTSVLEMAILRNQHLIIQNILSLLPNLYDAGALCAAISARMYSVVLQLISNRPPGVPTCTLEATAIGLAARLGPIHVLQVILRHIPCSNMSFVPDQLVYNDKANFSVYSFNVLQVPFWRDQFCGMGSPLALAITGGDAEACCELLQSGCQPDLLTWANIANLNDLHIAKVVFENSRRFGTRISNTHHGRGNPLCTSIQNNNKELTLLLLNAGIDVNNGVDQHPSCPPLQIAVDAGNLDMTNCLINAGADVNAYSPSGRSSLPIAVRGGNLEIVNCLINAGADVNAHNSKGDSSLQIAVGQGNLEIVNCLLNAGAKVNRCILSRKFSYSPLQIAVERGNLEIVNCLLNAGAKVNWYDRKCDSGRSPLQMAVEQGSLEIFNRLLSAGAEVNGPPAYTRGATALQLAAIKGHLGIARHLLELGAKVDASPAYKHGRTALEGAAEYGRLDMLELLIHNGALDGRDGRDQFYSSMRLAKKKGHMAAAELLRGCWRWEEKEDEGEEVERGSL